MVYSNKSNRFSQGRWLRMDRAKDSLLRSIDLIKRGIQLYLENDIPVFAGYTTLFIVTAFFPFVMLILSVINLFPGFSIEDVTDYFLQILPDLAPVKELIKSVITNLKDQSSGLLASAAAVATLWSASKGASAVQKGLNHLEQKEDNETGEAENYRTEGKIKGTVMSILKRLLFTVILIILIPAMLLFEMLGNSIESAIRNVLQITQTESINAVLEIIDSFFHVSPFLVMLFSFLVTLVIYTLLPSKRRDLKSLLPGAVFTVICWILFTKLFSLFVPWFFNFSLYGSLASLFLIFLWVLITVIILFVGDILNRVLEEVRQNRA